MADICVVVQQYLLPLLIGIVASLIVAIVVRLLKFFMDNNPKVPSHKVLVSKALIVVAIGVVVIVVAAICVEWVCNRENIPTFIEPTPTFIQIIDPKDGDSVPWRYTVKGTSNLPPSSDLMIYVFIYADKWYAQPKAYIFPDRVGEWETESPVKFGRPEDSGKGYTYKVCAIVTTQDFKVDESFTDFPDYDAKSKIIMVTRE